MYFKLSVRNIRRSVRDYAIYFVTLVFGVAVFYAFNSIGSQQILFDIENSASAGIFEMTQELLSLLSVFIALVLGFLIVYANRFLIKRRKHEFGIYLTLGMSAGEVSRIVLYETVLVGLVSLAVGLICGIVVSQALSFATAALFNITMSHYQFVFSPASFIVTLLCFAVIYVVVALFNLLTVRRYKLIDLLSAASKNEKMSVRNPWVCLVAFVIAIGIIAAAYWQLHENGMVYIDDQFFLATVLMLVGTFLLFWSLAGFVIAVLTRLRGVYLRGLVMFTVRQIASKVNTAFVSLWIICIMLFLSITTFSTGMGLIEVFCGNIEEASPYDASLRADVYYAEATDIVRPNSADATTRARAMQAEYPAIYADGEAYEWNMEAKMRDAVPTWDSFVARSVQVDTWEVPGVTYAPLVEAAVGQGYDTSSVTALDFDAVRATNLQVVGLSQINALLDMGGKDAIALDENHFLIANNMDATNDLARDIAQSGVSIDALGRNLAVEDDTLDIQLSDNAMRATALVIIVPDDVVESLRTAGAIPLTSYLNLEYVTPGAEGDAALVEALAQAFPVEGTEGLDDGYAHADDGYNRSLWPVTSTYTFEEMNAQAGGLRMMITYLALYIGFVFLIATAAVLAIQQLSEAADSQPRYELLSRLGCSRRSLSLALFAQVLVYFLAPLVVAACHSACAISVLSDYLFSALGTPVTGPILMAALFTLAIYGGYMLITYFASRSILKQAIAR